jgi:ABC-type ATPase with predicted acetyltransferase domain
MAEIRDAAMEKGNYAAAVAAEKSRGQAAGLYVSRTEIMVGKIDQMTKEEVLQEIQKLSREFPILLEATKPDAEIVMDLKTVREAGHSSETINPNDGRRRVPKYEQDSEDPSD